MWRLSDPKDFEALRRSRHRARRGPVSVTWLPGREAEPPRVAYALGRRIGGAVERNRLRRRLRAVVAESAPPPGAYLIGAQPSASLLAPHELKALVNEAFQAATAVAPCASEAP